MQVNRKRWCGVLLMCLAFLATTEPVRGGEPLKVIFDTDMGNDIDDALALGMIHSLESRGECELLAVTLSKDNALAARYVDLVNTFYGRPDIPVGRVHGGKTPKPGKFLPATVLATDDGKPRFPHDLTGEDDTPDATELLRQILAAQPDHSVAFVVVGFSTNLARLLESQPDQHSMLPGRKLVAKKVNLLSMMAGHYGEKRPKGFKEYNVVKDLEAARTVFAKWPTPIVASGYEIGKSILYPAASIERDFDYVPHHPLKEGYEAYGKMPYDRPTWDLTSVLYAARPDRSYFGKSSSGELTIGQDGFARHTAGGHGRHVFLTVTAEQIARVREALVMLSSQPPATR